MPNSPLKGKDKRSSTKRASNIKKTKFRKGRKAYLVGAMVVLFALVAFVFVVSNKKTSDVVETKKVGINDFTNSLARNTLVNIFQYGNNRWNSRFSPPTPPANHDSIVKFMDPNVSIPGMKYLSTQDAVPSDWVIQETQGFSFRHPSDYVLIPTGHQRIIFYRNNRDAVNGGVCIRSEKSYLSDDCPKPVFTLYYRSEDKNVAKEKMYNMSKGAFYALDGREWYVSTPGDPISAPGIGAETATAKKVIYFVFTKQNDSYFTDSNGLHGFNIRDEIYRMLSTVEIKDDIKIADLTIPDNTATTLYQINSPPENFLGDYSNLFLFNTTGLDYLPQEERELKFFQTPSGSRETYFFTFPSGYLKEGNYKYQGDSFTIQTGDQGLVPFIKDSKYCNVDSDCSYDSACGPRFTNGFQQSVEGHGCYSQIDDNGKFIGEYDETYKCVLASKFDGVACVSGKCSGVNYTYYCKQ